MRGEPTLPGLVIVKESVVQAPVAALVTRLGEPAVPKTGVARVCVVKSYRIRQIYVLHGQIL